MNRPQLISPAGTLKSMRYAFAYGADAVYAGQPRYSLRVRKNEFATLESLAQGISEAHAQGKQFYLTANILAHNAKVKTFLNDIAPLIELQPDALIMADPGLIMQVRQRWPDLAIHLSVQANTMNYASVQFWQAFGIQRLILSRELSLADIAEIRQQCPQIELEVFVHGALCIAYSGRCLLSGYFNHRDANQGSCTNACRWSYKLHGTYEQDDTIFLLEEQLRPQEYMPIFEDEHGSYIMNSKDLRAVQHISALKAIGIDAFKIEGRTKSFYYVARTARTYRRAIDT
ncbi:MAG: U32 family peptidase, partial [Pseudomonadota bacterium]|nr:U32 family peptidase [Pseudomonadota bacterium]